MIPSPGRFPTATTRPHDLGDPGRTGCPQFSLRPTAVRETHRDDRVLKVALLRRAADVGPQPPPNYLAQGLVPASGFRPG